MVADHQQTETIQLSARLKFNRKDVDDLIVFAAEAMRIPLAVISLPGYDKRYLSKSFRDDLLLKDIDSRFCRHVEQKRELVIAPDLLRDERFASKPFLKINLPVRFCAGVPLINSDDTVMGSVAFFDIKPRHLSHKQKKMLGMLAGQMMRLVEADSKMQLMRRREAELARLKENIVGCERKLKAFFKSSAFCHMLIGRDLEVIDFNKAAAVFVKDMCDKQLQTGKSVMQFISAYHKSDFMVCLTKAFSGRKIHKEILIKFSNKSPAWWIIFLEPLKDDDGKVIGVVYNATDINDQKQRIAEITAKNEQLANIAYVQSHEYRKPVASILGLMEVLRMGKQPLCEELQMMDEAVRELDQQIRKVIVLTQTLSSPE